MNLIPLKEFESNLVRLFFSKCNTAEIRIVKYHPDKIYGHRPTEAVRRFLFFYQIIGSCFSFIQILHPWPMTLAKYHTLDIPVMMAIIAIIITLCQDDDVDDDGMVCRTHRAQRGEISGAKTEPAVPYNTHLPIL